MSQLTKIWQGRNITKATKIKLMHSLVFSIFGYASKTWVIRQADRKRIDAFEMWCWRRMLRIPWTAKRSNISILREIQSTQRLSSTVYKKILKFFGHIMRSDNLERLTKEKRKKKGKIAHQMDGCCH